MGVASSDVFTPGASNFEGRLRYVLTRAADKVGPETKAQLLELVSPDSLKIIAGVLAAWIVAHAFGQAGSSLEASWKGSGVLVEGAALIYTGVVSGVGYSLYFTAGSP